MEHTALLLFEAVIETRHIKLCFNLLCYRGWEELQGDDNDRLGWQDSPSWDLFRFKHVLQLLMSQVL